MTDDVTDVLIAGAGPVGLLLAAELRLAGVDVAVVERLPAPSGQSRAFGLHARTIEELDQRGVLSGFADGGFAWSKIHFAGLREVDLDELGMGGYSLKLAQATTEQLLTARAEELGARIERGAELTDLRQDAAGVTATIGSSRQTRAKYLVGCDGGRSTVRTLAGIDFPGSGSSVSAVIGDVVAPPQPRGPVMQMMPGGIFMALPVGPDRYRVMAVEYTKPEAEDGDPTLSELEDAVERVTGRRIPLADPTWLSRFGDATRLADRYRAGRVLIAGDAAHIHFPAGGQGLNLGMQDATNLGWKLALVVAGAAPAGLLDTYAAERRPVAHRILVNTQTTLALMAPGPLTAPLRETFGELMELEQVQRYVAGMISGLDIRYEMPDGPHHPLLGARLPDLALTLPGHGRVRARDLLHTGCGLLVDAVGGRLAERVAGWADRVEPVVTSDLPLDGVTGLLVRPDGYVAWVGTADDTEGPAAALDRWFGPARAAVPSAA